jgi:hypothetical protein
MTLFGGSERRPPPFAVSLFAVEGLDARDHHALVTTASGGQELAPDLGFADRAYESLVQPGRWARIVG